MKIIISLIILITSTLSFSQTGWINQSGNFPSNNNHTYSSIYAVSPSVCYLVTSHLSIPIADSNNYIVFKTTNGGNNWVIISQGMGYYLKTVHFINENTGYAGGGYYYYYPTLEDERGQVITKTTNGGVNWSTVFNFVMPMLTYNIDFTDLTFIDANTGWACSIYGNILRTTNGGTNWTGQNTPSAFKKYSIHFVNGQKGWVAGDTGKIAFTTNAGTNWIMQTSGTTNKIKSIYFTDINTGWACGDSGLILNTINSGVNWARQNSNTTDSLNAITFTNANSGWIAGKNKIFATTNGGTNWVLQFANFTASLNSITFFDSQSGWVCGSRSVYATTTGGTSAERTGNNIPGEIKLLQNYPNPFNSITNVKLQLSKQGFAEIKLFDVNGKLLNILIKKNLKPGEYIIKYNAGELPSGVYFYTLYIDNAIIKTRKFMLLK